MKNCISCEVGLNKEVPATTTLEMNCSHTLHLCSACAAVKETYECDRCADIAAAKEEE